MGKIINDDHKRDNDSGSFFDSILPNADKKQVGKKEAVKATPKKKVEKPTDPTIRRSIYIKQSKLDLIEDMKYTKLMTEFEQLSQQQIIEAGLDLLAQSMKVQKRPQKYIDSQNKK